MSRSVAFRALSRYLGSMGALLRTAEAAEYLGMTVKAVRRLGRQGVLTPAYQAKGIIYWSRAQLERFAMADAESYGTEEEQQHG
jgi:hypothetical protein